MVSDGNHIPPHGPKGAGSKGSGSSPEWLTLPVLDSVHTVQVLDDL